MIRGMEETIHMDTEEKGRARAWQKPALIGLAAVIIVIIAAFLITPVRATIAHVWFQLTASEEAKQLIVAGGNPGMPTKFQTFAAFGREELMLSVEGLVIDYAERDGIRIASVANPAAMSSELYLLGETAEQLTQDLYTKTEIAISHDGSRIAYSAPAEKRFIGPFFSLVPQDWTVMVMDLATREITEVGQGHGAEFADPNDSSKILYSSPAGLTLVDIDTGERTVNGNVPTFNASFPVRISDDGTKALVLDSTAGTYSVYMIERESLVLTPIAMLPHKFASAVLTDTTAYWVKKGVEGSPSELWSLQLEEGAKPRREYTFFGGFIVTRVIHP